MSVIEPPRLVTVAEAARLLSVSKRTISNLIRAGKLIARGERALRRITRESIDRYVEGLDEEPEDDKPGEGLDEEPEDDKPGDGKSK